MPALLPWPEANQRYLSAALAELHACLVPKPIGKAKPKGKTESSASIAANMSAPPALEKLCKAFDLTNFERQLLLLCAGVELDACIAAKVAAMNGDARRINVTFSCALATLPEAHWSAIAPEAALRRWRLIEVGNGDTLATSPLRIDERVLHYLTGLKGRDERLAPLFSETTPPEELPPSQAPATQSLVQLMHEGTSFIHLSGQQPEARLNVAATACAMLGLRLHVLHAVDLPTSPAEREALARLWEREAMLTESALVVDCDDVEPIRHAIAFIESVQGFVIATSAEPIRAGRRKMARLFIPGSAQGEQEAIWRVSLGTAAAVLNGQVDAVCAHFDLSPEAIRAASLETLQRITTDPRMALWNACRVQARQRLDGLAQRIEPAARWDDLVLPAEQMQTLRQMTAQVKHRARVLHRGGFAKQGERGLALCALFAGPSGTGKTMAAEVLANELALDLYRIDLSALISKYIGETAKNVRRVFRAAQAGGAILFFDEGDAVFGKRSEVRDSHDRFANTDVSDLLQCIESYRGLVLITTNMKAAIDTAFQRRIRFKVEFPFPDQAQRARIWRQVFPAETITEGLNYDKLARLNLSGGHIRNVALNAAFLAADDDQPVRMKHLLLAAQTEYAKLDKPLSPGETGGWV